MERRSIMARSTIWLDITEEDLKFGKRKAADSCPIALSLARALGSNGSWSLYVDGFKWAAESPGHIRIQGKATLRARQFVNRWDRGEVLEPQQIRLWLGN